MQRLRLAVHQARQQEGIGQWLLMDAIKRFALMGEQDGAQALLVHARHLRDQRLYRRLGFEVLKVTCMSASAWCLGVRSSSSAVIRSSQVSWELRWSRGISR